MDFKFTPSVKERIIERCSYGGIGKDLENNVLEILDDWMYNHLIGDPQHPSDDLQLRTIPLFDTLGKTILNITEKEFNQYLEKTLEQYPALWWNLHEYECEYGSTIKVCTLPAFAEIFASMLTIFDQEELLEHGKLAHQMAWAFIAHTLMTEGWNAVKKRSFRNIFTEHSYKDNLKPLPRLGDVLIQRNSLAVAFKNGTLHRGTTEANFIEKHYTPLVTMARLFENNQDLEEIIKAVLNEKDLSEWKKELYCSFPYRRHVLDEPFEHFFHTTPLDVCEIVACLEICSTIYYTDQQRETNSPKLFTFCKMASMGWAAFKIPEFRACFETQTQHQPPASPVFVFTGLHSNQNQDTETQKSKKTKTASTFDLPEPQANCTIRDYISSIQFDDNVEPELLHRQFIRAFLKWQRHSDNHYRACNMNMIITSLMNKRFGNNKVVEDYLINFHMLHP